MGIFCTGGFELQAYMDNKSEVKSTNFGIFTLIMFYSLKKINNKNKTVMAFAIEVPVILLS